VQSLQVQPGDERVKKGSLLMADKESLGVILKSIYLPEGRIIICHLKAQQLSLPTPAIDDCAWSTCLGATTNNSKD
jgi:hypothetical protein